MKKRIISLLLVLCLVLALLPAGAFAFTSNVEVCDCPDTVVGYNRSVNTVYGDKQCAFSYTVPQGGKTMLIFYSATCGNSWNMLSELSESPLLEDDSVNIVAVETYNELATVKAMLSDCMGSKAEKIQNYYLGSQVMWDYVGLLDGGYSITWPVVVIIEDVNGSNVIKNYGISIPYIDKYEKAIYGEVPDYHNFPVYQVPGTMSYGSAVKIAELLNEDRAENGLKPVKLDAQLTEFAMQRAAECAMYYSHMRPDGTQCFEVVETDVFIGMMGENIAAGHPTPQDVEEGWMNSPGHRANILTEEFTHVGIGCFCNNGVWYWVQLFSDTGLSDKAVTSEDVFTVASVKTDPELTDMWYSANPELSDEMSLKVSDTINLYFYNWNMGTGFSETNLLPTVADISDEATGRTIAKAEMCRDAYGDAYLRITACGQGSGTLKIEPFSGDTDARLIKLTVTDSHVHSYTAETVAPTCTEQGYTVYTCECGDSYIDDYTDPQGHSFSKGICLNCGAADPDYSPGAPAITVQPVPVKAWQGDTVSFSVKAEGENLSYAWYAVDAGVPTYLGGGESVTIENVKTEHHNGYYFYCVVSNDYGKATSTKALLTVEKQNPFVDVSKDAVYYDAVLWGYYHEPQQITGGFDESHFRPQDTCTRAQVVTFLWRAKGCPEPTTSNNPFSDVRAKQSNGKDNPYYKAILWAAEKGITTGYAGGLFKPNASVTRAQFVTFLWRAEGKPATTGSINGFVDASTIATPYQTAVAWAVEKGITMGYENNTFRPNAVCTRWAVVLFMYRDMA